MGENLLREFKAARWAARAADSDGGRLARKAKNGVAETRGSHAAAADLTRGPLAAAVHRAYTGGLRGSPIAGKRTAAAPVSNPPPRRRRANPRRPVPTGEKQHR
jgi:hypothetical protein